MSSLVQPNAWVSIRLPNEVTRALQVVPNTTISLGKYGSFPSNLIIERPYNLTYEIQDKRNGESYSRLRVVPGIELNADKLADLSAGMINDGIDPNDLDGEIEMEIEDENDNDNVNDNEKRNEPIIDFENDGADIVIRPAAGEELTLVDEESGRVIARSTREVIDENARQTLTTEEIEDLKRHGASAGKDLVAKLMLSHTAIDQKTAYSLAKYKLLKEKKYMRRFTVLPLDVPQLAHWMLMDRDPGKVMEMRQEMIGLLGCWADVHFGGRWLAVDDTGGLLVAAMAERMGILHQHAFDDDEEEDKKKKKNIHNNNNNKKTTTTTTTITTTTTTTTTTMTTTKKEEDEEEDEEEKEKTKAAAAAAAPTTEDRPNSETAVEAQGKESTARNPRKRPHRDDLEDHYAHSNTITVIHSNSQPSLALLRYYGFDACDPTPPAPHHPLFTRLLPISWLQLLDPMADPAYADSPPSATPEELLSWKSNRRANYHRKRRRWARVRQIVDSSRAGGFAGLAVSSTMDPVSVLRHALPLLAGGAPIAIYSPSIEPLTQLADCFSIGRRGAWAASPPPETEGRTLAELERWEGSAEFPLNPSLLIGAAVQTSRATRWQVLPGRTHPFMTEKGGATGYLFTGWRAVPAEGRVAARGKFQKRR